MSGTVHDEVDAKRAELVKQLERTRDQLATTDDALDGARTALMYERGRNKSPRAREKAVENPLERKPMAT